MGLIQDAIKKLRSGGGLFGGSSLINRAIKAVTGRETKPLITNRSKRTVKDFIEDLRNRKRGGNDKPKPDTTTPTTPPPVVDENPLEELPPPPNQIPDIPYEDDCEQVVFPPEQPNVEVDLSTLDFTNTAEVFQAIAQNIRAQAESRKTGEPIQNKQRYKRVDDGWTISVKEQGYTRMLSAGPILAPDGQMVEPLRPLLADDSGLMIIHLTWDGTEHFLCSPSAKEWIDKMKYQTNPHRSPIVNARVEVKPLDSLLPGPVTLIGCTIPITHIDATKLETIAYNETLNLRMAGIADVDYIYETTIDPNNPFSGNVVLPKGLVQQINYTISRSQNRATGSMESFSIPFMQSNYTAYIDEIRTLVGKSEQEDKVYYMGKLETFQEDVYPIWEKIVDDNNALKRMFYDGNIPNEITETEAVVDLPQIPSGKTPDPRTYTPRTFKRARLIDIFRGKGSATGSGTTPTTTTTPVRGTGSPTTTSRLPVNGAV